MSRTALSKHARIRTVSSLWRLLWLAIIFCESFSFPLAPTFPTRSPTLSRGCVRTLKSFSETKQDHSPSFLSNTWRGNGQTLRRRKGLLGARDTKCSGEEPASFEVTCDDGHAVKVWSKGEPGGRAIVLLHGRTWSARPVWDLQVGDPPRDGAGGLGASTMDMLSSKGMLVFCPDFRGLGGTSRDEEGWTRPRRCVDDVVCVLQHLAQEQGVERPPLVGWSQGALVAQLVAQRHPALVSAAILYGSIYDPTLSYPHTDQPAPPSFVENTLEGAMEDWTVEGLIDAEAAAAFGEAAMTWDPRKVSWGALHEFNELDPSKVTVPSLVIFGENDSYSTVANQVALFEGISASNKALRMVPRADHPVHLYPRERRIWLNDLTAFLDSLT